MERFFDFIQNHYMLFGAFVSFVVAYFVIESKRGGKKISPNQLGIMVTNEHAKVIDLRATKEFEAGHISGSESINFSQLESEIERLKSLTVPVIFVCKMGTHAASAVQKLGNDKAFRLEGGILNWQSVGLPLISKNQKTKNKK